ncbi:protease (processing of pro-sigma-K to active sigma-K) [Alkalihalophilus pseudofirmus OF4]|uniref:Protease (Processing of pro-sigma-K to active sigma-K) n=1 Tax=Alkalihalophilus pseudofirmus (strain ATCC BAA-2126 / JCM 17055 / OF4) TaxID=398511 RepID=D3FW84_ALKPO|nr:MULTISPECIES: M50 family metallopeptidase [Alkalihalophilus]ADC48616.1 protease (processing of pro-sigma-K to active sigma-K) [Alkalihalophilus pseudofirmus OF4]MED1602951.1 M50 family metallopeptidase [Alkalihalophilus marmarensis]
MSSLWYLLSKMKINPFFWVVLGGGVITGYFREVLLVFAIVFIHEMGHAIAAHSFKWRIHKIELLPFGGVAEVEDSGNRPIKEELIVILAGPLQHVWMIGLSYILLYLDVWSQSTHELFVWHNLTILLVNLAPILPLDGGRFIQLLYMKYFSYHMALIRSWSASCAVLGVVTIFSAALFPFHLNLWVVLSFLMIVHYLEWKQRHYRMMRFLIGRPQTQKVPKKKIKSVAVSGQLSLFDGIKKMYRGYIHEFHYLDPATKKRVTVCEAQVLDALIQKKQWQITFAELASR